MTFQIFRLYLILQVQLLQKGPQFVRLQQILPLWGTLKSQFAQLVLRLVLPRLFLPHDLRKSLTSSETQYLQLQLRLMELQQALGLLLFQAQHLLCQMRSSISFEIQFPPHLLQPQLMLLQLVPKLIPLKVCLHHGQTKSQISFQTQHLQQLLQFKVLLQALRSVLLPVSLAHGLMKCQTSSETQSPQPLVQA